jgi:hypothetical protein
MDAALTIDVGTLLGLLIIVGIILAVYLIIAVYNLVKTLKQTQKVLSDLEGVAEIASKRTKELDKFIASTQNKVKSGQNVFNAVPIIVSAVTQIAKVVGQNQQKKS